MAIADRAVAEEPIVAVQVDLSEFTKSKLGELMVKAGTTLAAQEMGKDPEEAMEAVIQSIGFNPLEQDIKLNVAVMDLEDPMNGLQVNAQLKDSTGNLEGLLLAAPEYRAITYGDHTIHAADVDGQEVFVAFYNGASGKKHIAFAPSEATVRATLDGSNDSSASDTSLHDMADGQFLSVQLLSMPEEIADVPPIANIGNMVDSFSMGLREEGSNLVATVTLATENAEQATQIQQLAQGAIAMLGLFKEEIREELGDDVVAGNVIPVLDQISVTREDKAITIESKIPEALLIEFLREEADLPL
ncbi:MAG: hypothetical protein AAGG48_27115 [Planctomycetota bacterium]